MESREFRLDLERVAEDQGNMETLVFRAADGERLTIAIGPCEGLAIRLSRDPRFHRGNQARPMTHDLLSILLERFGAKLQRVVIDDFWRGTYYARLEFDAGGQPFSIDARPSDAIALALRHNITVFATDEVLHPSADTNPPGRIAADDAPPSH